SCFLLFFCLSKRKVTKEKDRNTKDKPSLSVQLFYVYGFRVCPRWCCIPARKSSQKLFSCQ
ncbi:MAG: hypothetical protein H7Y04_05410, partial [Verrucomicrobia bacterium]|nr:hypothetical protein [Cytophagales bacterium]